MSINIADLKYSFYGGGADAEYETLLTAYDQGRTASEVIAPPYMWWSYATGETRHQVIANNTWTPIHWGEGHTDLMDLYPTDYTATTTIAAGSNGAALPQATINVESTTGFRAASANAPEFIVVTLADGNDRVIKYTGMTATTFTGCTLGTGSLATAQAVRQGMCKVFTGPRFHCQIAEIAFTAHATGGRGIRFRDATGPFFFVGGQMGPVQAPPVGAGNPHMQAVMQAVGNPDGTGGNWIEAYQSSGSAMILPNEGISSPSLMSIPLGPNLHS